MDKMKLRCASLFLACLVLLAGPTFGVMTPTRIIGVSGSWTGMVRQEETSAANTQLVATTITETYSRRLISVVVVCSASTSITVSVTAQRAKEVSGSIDAFLPNITLTATTSGALIINSPLASSDVVIVDVPAGGGGITCTVQTIEMAS